MFLPHQMAIADLPQELTPLQAVTSAYHEDLVWIEAKLRQGLSVLVETDKVLVNYFFIILRDWLKDPARGLPLGCEFLAGRSPAPDGRPGNLISRMLAELAERVVSGEARKILVLPHLDLLTTTSQSSLNMEAREAIAWFYENPEITILGFKDPSFVMPRPILNFFTVKRTIIGIARDKLAQLILQREARKFGIHSFNPYSLYKYLSGVNAIRLRTIMGSLSTRLDFDPAVPELRTQLVQEIRAMTLSTEFAIPQIDMEQDIGGYAAVKRKLRENLLDLYQACERDLPATQRRIYEQLLPRGVIFSGPPGTGKTFFAKAIATSLNAALTVISGPELKSKWVGESEANLRRVFTQARRNAPAVIVFDEIDAFASARGMYQGSGVEHSMVNQLLTEMDGFRQEELVLVIATTNLLEAVDPALLRPGRFELQIEIPYPNVEDRRAILAIYQRQFALQLSEELFELIIERTGGYVDRQRQIKFSGDHLAALARALARRQMQRSGPLTREEVIQALASKNIPQLTPEEQRVLACHEAGHALAAALLPCASPIAKVTIASGDSDILGLLIQEVRRNRYIIKQQELYDDIAVLLAGQVAEQLLEKQKSAGAYDDLGKASEISRLMVEEWGMGPLGPRVYKQPHGQFVAVSPQRQAALEEAIDQILQEQQTRIRDLFVQHRDLLGALAGQLMVHKSLTRSQVTQLMKQYGVTTLTPVQD